MTLGNDKDVLAIREWMAKENYLPTDLEDIMIKKFLHSCYGSLEKTKKCIEKFCSGRYNMPELYISRDPCSAKLQNAFDIAGPKTQDSLIRLMSAALSYMSTFNAGTNEILMHHLEVPTLDKFDYYDVLKTFTIQADYWLKVHEFMPDGHIVIMDIKHITLRIIPKINVFYFQKLLIYLLEAMPIRLKQVHVVNCPSYYEKLYALVKTALPQDIIDLISFHSTYEGLHSSIDRKYLPEEYGGDAPSYKQQHKEWVTVIKNDRKLFLNDNMWKADLTKKSKANGDDIIMNGSFRTLSID